MKLICVPEDELLRLLEKYKEYSRDTIDDQDPREHCVYVGKVMLIEQIIKMASKIES